MTSNIDELTGKPKIILDLCGGTGSWSRPYNEAGYDVRLVTLPDGDVRTYQPPDNVYGILAAPPCTEFSLAKGGLKRDFEGGLEIVEACLHVIWKCRIQRKLAFWAMENPKGFLRQFLGVPKYQFEHWEFDKDAKMYKPTDLWGWFHEPVKTVFERPKIPYQCTKKGRKQAAWYDKRPSRIGVACWLTKTQMTMDDPDLRNLDRAALRAITPRGFAEAFFKANR